LMQSLKKVHPDWHRYVLLVDRNEGTISPESLDFDLVEVEDLNLPDKEKFLFR
jgi:hypothetical protein